MSGNNIEPPGLEAVKRLVGWSRIDEKRKKIDFSDSLVFTLRPDLKESFTIEIIFNIGLNHLSDITLNNDLPVFTGYPLEPWRNMIDGLKLVRSLVRGRACLLYMLSPDGTGRPNPYSGHLLAANEPPSPLMYGYSRDFEYPEGEWIGFDSKRYRLPPFRRAFFNRPAVDETLDPGRYRPYQCGWLLRERFEEALALEEKLKMPLKDRLCGGRYREKECDGDDDD